MAETESTSQFSPCLPFYFDHNMPLPIATGLRKKGLDLLTAEEDQTESWSDRDLWQKSVQHEPSHRDSRPGFPRHCGRISSRRNFISWTDFLQNFGCPHKNLDWRSGTDCQGVFRRRVSVQHFPYSAVTHTRSTLNTSSRTDARPGTSAALSSGKESDSPTSCRHIPSR